METMEQQTQNSAAQVQESGDDLLLLPELADLTRCPINTLRALRAQRRGPKTFRLVGRVVARRRDVLAWIAEQEAGDAA